MATTRLSDAVIPSVYLSYMVVNDPVASKLVQSGAVSTGEMFDAMAAEGGKTATAPFWNDLDASIEPNYSNDDPADLATANKLTSGSMTARKSYLNQGFADMDLVKELAGSDPGLRIRDRFANYWVKQFEYRVVRSALGVLADNIANDAGDMAIDISGAAGDDAIFNRDAFIDAAGTILDADFEFSAVIAHSKIVDTMDKSDDIITIPDSKGAPIKTYRNATIVKTNTVPTTGTGADTVYTTILLGNAAIGFGGVNGTSAFFSGQGQPKTPVELYRDPHIGNGGGGEEIWERKTWIIHPFGFEWIEGTLADFSPALSELDDAAHWNRIVNRRYIPMAFIKSKAAPVSGT